MSLPVACLEFPGVSRKGSIRGLGFLLPSSRRAPGPAALFLLVPARCPALLFIPRRAPSPRGDPRLAIAPGTPTGIFAATPGIHLVQGEAPGILRLCPGAGTDGLMNSRAPTVKHAPNRAPERAPTGGDRGALKGATPRPPTPAETGQRRRSPLAGPAPPASPIGQRLPGRSSLSAPIGRSPSAAVLALSPGSGWPVRAPEPRSDWSRTAKRAGARARARRGGGRR